MLFSVALILSLGFIAGLLVSKIKVPKLVGMLIVGLLLGPYVFNLLDPKLLAISSELRLIALVIILTRAGLSLDIQALKKIGRPAILLCFIPATFEIIGITIFAPLLLGISTFEALLLGSVLAAVSPAVVVPAMIKLQDENYGGEHKIPELIMAGASVDDIYVIILFYSFLGLAENNVFNASQLLKIPTSIVLGIIFGILVGLLLSTLFRKMKIALPVKILILLSVSLLLISGENFLESYVPFSALLSVITIGIILLMKNKDDAIEIEKGYRHLWTFFEIVLFVLVGAMVDLNLALSSGFSVLLLLFIALTFRSLGVLISLIKTNITMKEKLFTVFAYLPKATVQASIGGIALASGLDSGNIILTVAFLSNLIAAPLGALLIDTTYKKLLNKKEIAEIS